MITCLLRGSVLLCVVVTSGFAQAVAPNPAATAPLERTDVIVPKLPFRRPIGGYACSGYLHITQQRIVWKSSFRTCRASSWKTMEKGKVWALRLKQTAAERKACGMEVIVMRAEFPDGGGAPPWEVIGYTSEKDYKANAMPTLACNMD